jgi:peptidase E
MAADRPTIVATSGGLRRGGRTLYGFGPLLLHAIERAGVEGRAPVLCQVGTAMGDDRWLAAQLSEAGEAAGVVVRHCNLFPMPPSADLVDYVGSCDAVWVGGGSVANLLALWRLHGLDQAMTAAWRAGVVLAGVSAGSLCWHVGGTTDSFRPELDPVTNGLGLLPYGNGVHYDSEARRRPLLQSLVADGTFTEAYATDDGVGLVYEGTDLVEAVAEVDGKGAYHLTRVGDLAREERLEPRGLAS